MSQEKLPAQKLNASREAAERLQVQALWRRVEWELAGLSIPVQDRLQLLAGCVGRFLGRNTTPEALAGWVAALEAAAVEASSDPAGPVIKDPARLRNRGQGPGDQ